MVALASSQSPVGEERGGVLVILGAGERTRQLDVQQRQRVDARVLAPGASSTSTAA
jgi:hypothetical protein